MWKMENSPPQTYEFAEIVRNSSLNFGEDLFFFFFWRSPEIGRKKTFEFRISAETSLRILAKTFFFGDHLILGGENLWISELSETFRLKFWANRLKLIQDQWKFESRSFVHFSLFQNSPPPFSKSWLRACQITYPISVKPFLFVEIQTGWTNSRFPKTLKSNPKKSFCICWTSL